MNDAVEERARWWCEVCRVWYYGTLQDVLVGIAVMSINYLRKSKTPVELEVLFWITFCVLCDRGERRFEKKGEKRDPSLSSSGGYSA